MATFAALAVGGFTAVGLLAAAVAGLLYLFSQRLVDAPLSLAHSNGFVSTTGTKNTLSSRGMSDLSTPESRLNAAVR